MSVMSRVSWLGFSALLLAVVGACKGSDDSLVGLTAGGTGGMTPGVNLNVGKGGNAGNGGADEVAGAAGQVEGPQVAGCERFVGLDECGVTSVEASFSAANVLLVIDKSSSMDDQPQGFELKKWAALKAALAPALEAVQDEMSFGLLLYPFNQQSEIPLDCFEGCCQVPAAPEAVEVGIERGSDSASKVMAALDATAPGGGTPTAAALDAALFYFTNGPGKDLKGDRFVLLATDGGPNCGGSTTTCAADHCTPNLDGLCPADEGNCCRGEGSYCLDDAAVLQKIRALADASVPTFVIGIPGTESYAEYLDAFATAGGVPNPKKHPAYYAVSAEGGVDGLTRTFRDITTHLVRSCEVDLGSMAPDKQLVNVAVDCEIVPFEAGAGWDIRDETPTTLTLAGDTCNRVKREGARRIDVVYGCPTVK
ncbi:MAG TPA: vWA domain-containing protein [Polyangiaceae bacterium]|nr:vWA domain-containing protein [Polyangiaceae bacterium]